ncbi:MAG: hypothetical protein U0326_08775 [Polyangiales bacterium]
MKAVTLSAFVAVLRSPQGSTVTGRSMKSLASSMRSSTSPPPSTSRASRS